jgi:hypothetical protein
MTRDLGGRAAATALAAVLAACVSEIPPPGRDEDEDEDEDETTAHFCFFEETGASQRTAT